VNDLVRDTDRESENMIANQEIKIYFTFTSKSESSKAGNLVSLRTHRLLHISDTLY